MAYYEEEIVSNSINNVGGCLQYFLLTSESPSVVFSGRLQCGPMIVIT